jgi:hypothetical protein
MVISLGPTGDRPRRRLRGGSRLPASASNLVTADSEIAAGRIALFTPACAGLVSVALTRSPACQSGLSTPGRPCASPAFTGHPRSVQLGLSSGVAASDHPCPPRSSVVNVRGSRAIRIWPMWSTAKRSPDVRRTAVPKGRFELPRGYPHYALNVARLPVPPLRLVLCPPSTGPEPTSGLEPETCCLRNSCSTN